MNPIIQNGLIPVFLDIGLPTYNIDVSLLNEAIGPRTKAIMRLTPWATHLTWTPLWRWPGATTCG